MVRSRGGQVNSAAEATQQLEEWCRDDARSCAWLSYSTIQVRSAVDFKLRSVQPSFRSPNIPTVKQNGTERICRERFLLHQLNSIFPPAT